MRHAARNPRPSARRRRWLVAADSSRARICTLDNNNNVAQEIEDYVQPASRLRGAALSADRHGRTFDSSGAGRHAMESKQTIRLGPVSQFARLIEERLQRGREAEEYEEVLIAAPPRFLGILRRQLDARTAERVAREIPKNIVRCDRRGLRKAVVSGAPVPASIGT